MKKIKDLETKPSDSGRVAELEQTVAELKEELEIKINSTPQMKNMQKMLKDKNQIIEDLRK